MLLGVKDGDCEGAIVLCGVEFRLARRLVVTTRKNNKNLDFIVPDVWAWTGHCGVEIDVSDTFIFCSPLSIFVVDTTFFSHLLGD